MKGTANSTSPKSFPRHTLAHTISLLLVGLAPLYSHTAHGALTTIDGQTILTDAPSAPAVSVAPDDTLQISNSRVDTTGKGASALVTRGTLIGENVNVLTTGFDAQAAQVLDNGRLELNNSNLTTEGGGAVGLQVDGDKAVAHFRDGSITTNGNTAYGVYAVFGGQVVLNNASVITADYSAMGVNIYLGGDAQLAKTTVSTNGIEAHGVMLLGLDESHRVTALITDSQITTQDDVSMGVNVNDLAQATLENTQITTSGEGSDGVWLASPGTTSATLTNVNIMTNGPDAKGVSSQGGTATLQDVTITTRGVQSHGLYSDGDTASLTATGIHIRLDQLGAGAFAVNNGAITLDTGTVTAQNGAIGLLSAASGKLSATAITVNASGRGATAAMLREGGTLTLDDVRATATGASSVALLAEAKTSTQKNLAMVKNSNLMAAQSTAIGVNGGQFELKLQDSYVSGRQLLNVNERVLDDGTTVAHGDVDIAALNSTLQGDIRVAGSSTGLTQLHLQDSSLIGAVAGLDQLDILGSSRWTLTADSTLKNLNNQGTVVFQSGGAFKTLTIAGDLTGSGVFALNTQVADQRGDLLRISGSHSGSHTLAVADSGREPSAANGQLLLVDGNGGTGTFSLAGRPYVDAGAYRYTLEQQGDDWLLRNTAQTTVNQPDSLSDGANAALGSQTAAATLWNAEMNALVKRLGELRMGNDNGGLWTRGIRKTFEVDGPSSRRFNQQVNGLEIGADTAIPMAGSKLYVGGMLGTAQSTQQYAGNSHGKIDSQLLGVYATWLNDDGYYVDTLAKYNHMRNEVKNQDNTGQQIKGRFNTYGYAANVEVGRQIPLADSWFVEPQSQLTYTHTEGVRYTTSNGLSVDAGDSDTLQGRLGTRLGKSLQLANGMNAQPYAKLSYVHEFADHSNVTVNGHKLRNRVSGSRGEVGGGGIVQISERTKVALDIQHAKGEQVEEPWAINLGLRYLW